MKKDLKIIFLTVILTLFAVVFIYCAVQHFGNSGMSGKIDELLADDVEIERKWLIKEEDIPYDLSAKGVKGIDILQTYIFFEPEIRVRDYNNGGLYEMTIKNNMSKDGLVRDETIIEITKEEYDNLMQKKEGITIHKTRYELMDKENVVAIDIFHGELEGLAYMEIEFKNRAESEAYPDPDWVIADVTSDVRYKNGHLARFGIPERDA